MKKNVGSIDKIVRVIIAIVTAYFANQGNFESNWISIALYAVAIIMLATSLMGSCPIYSLIGFKTKK